MPAPDERPTLEACDDDPHLWLQEIENGRVLDGRCAERGDAGAFSQ